MSLAEEEAWTIGSSLTCSSPFGGAHHGSKRAFKWPGVYSADPDWNAKCILISLSSLSSSLSACRQFNQCARARQCLLLYLHVGKKFIKKFQNCSTISHLTWKCKILLSFFFKKLGSFSNVLAQRVRCTTCSCRFVSGRAQLGSQKEKKEKGARPFSSSCSRFAFSAGVASSSSHQIILGSTCCQAEERN